MRILIDFTQIPIARTGVGVYAENLVRELAPLLHPEDTLFLLIQDDELALPAILKASFGVDFVIIPSRYFRRRALLFIFEQTILPLILLQKRIDVVHSLHYTHPFLTRSRRVVTIHDFTFLLYPRLHTLSRRIIMPFFLRHAIRHAEALIFVSHSACEDSARLVPGGHALKAVIPHGVDSHFFEAPKAEDIRTALEKLNVRRPFLLFVGTIEPRKNIVRLVQAFESVADGHRDLTLVIAGKLGWDYADVLDAIDKSRHRDRIRRLGFITDAEKKALLNACDILVYPSLYEGFGLPVLEAMAARAPVVTSNTSSLPEVVGDAALCVDPLTISALASAISAILEDPGKKLTLQAAGEQRASIFTWKNTADLTYRTYDEVLQKSQTSQPESLRGST